MYFYYTLYQQKYGTLYKTEETMKNITVFLGSRLPKDPIYIEAVKALGEAIANNHNTLIYGGAQVGTMGILADAALNKNGKVIGIMPKVLSDKEILHPGITETFIVKDMHERKALLQEMGDVFITMPGGCGSMEEIFEIITARQIGIHTKPFCFINIDNFYKGIQDYLENAFEQGFISEKDFKDIRFFDSIEALMESNLI